MLELNYSDNRELYQYLGTRLQIYSLGSLINHTLKYQFTNVSKQDEYMLTSFFIGCQGKLKRFWLPYYKNSFVLAVPFLGGDVVETVNTGFNEVDRGAERIFIKLKNGTFYTREVTAVVDHGTTELIVLKTTLPAITQNEIHFFGRLFLVRFNEDECMFDFKSNTTSSCTLTFQEVYQESLEVAS